MLKDLLQHGATKEMQIYLVERSIETYIEHVISILERLIREIDKRIEEIYLDPKNLGSLTTEQKEIVKEVKKLELKRFSFAKFLDEVKKCQAMHVSPRNDLLEATARDKLLEQIMKSMGLPEPPVPPMLAQQ